MLWRKLLGLVAQELAKRAAVVAAPGDAALRVDALQVAYQQHAEVHPRRDAGPAQLLTVELLPKGPFQRAAKARALEPMDSIIEALKTYVRTGELPSVPA